MAASKLSWSLAALTLPALFAGGYVFSHRVPELRGVPGDTIALAVLAEKECGSGDSSRACYERKLTGLVETRGVRVAMGTLNRLANRSDEIRRHGHVYSHAIGITAGQGRDDVSARFAECTEILQSGCYHGVIQGYFESASAVDSSSVNRLCADYQVGDRQWLRFQCVHGLGHGLTMYFSHHLPSALTACDHLVVDWDRNSCYGGAFMENVINATVPHHPGTRLAAGRDSAVTESAHQLGGGHHHGPSAPVSPSTRPPVEFQPTWKAIDSTDRHYPCSIMAQRYLRECYVMQTSVMLYLSENIEEASRTCAAAPGEYRYICHQSLGRDISARAQMDARRAALTCALVENEFEPWCHFGVVKDFIGVGAQPQVGIRYCAQVSGGRNKMMCYFAAGEQIAALLPSIERRGRECLMAEEEYRESCLFGAGIAPAPPAGFPRPRRGD